jgi:hypothetical protein
VYGVGVRRSPKFAKVSLSITGVGIYYHLINTGDIITGIGEMQPPRKEQRANEESQNVSTGGYLCVYCPG